MGLFQFTMLLIENDLELLYLLSQDIRKQGPGITVLTASNGFDAVEILKKNKVNVVVSDLEMPEIDGIGLRKLAMKEVGTLPEIWIGYSGAAKVDIEGLKALGFDELLFKPLSTQMLVNTCAGLLRLDQNRSKNHRNLF